MTVKNGWGDTVLAMPTRNFHIVAPRPSEVERGKEFVLMHSSNDGRDWTSLSAIDRKTARALVAALTDLLEDDK